MKVFLEDLECIILNCSFYIKVEEGETTRILTQIQVWDMLHIGSFVEGLMLDEEFGVYLIKTTIKEFIISTEI